MKPPKTLVILAILITPSTVLGQLTKQEKSLINLTNKARAEYNLPPLQVSADLMAQSRLHASYMARTNRFNHSRTRKVSASENIAYNYQGTERALEQWMTSRKGHRENILGPHKTIGVGIAASGRRIYFVQQFGGTVYRIVTYKPRGRRRR